MKTYVEYFDKDNMECRVAELKYWDENKERFIVEDYHGREKEIKEDRIIENVYRVGDKFFSEKFIEKILKMPNGVVINRI
jgi:hypothetical protein